MINFTRQHRHEQAPYILYYVFYLAPVNAALFNGKNNEPKK